MCPTRIFLCSVLFISVFLYSSVGLYILKFFFFYLKQTIITECMYPYSNIQFYLNTSGCIVKCMCFAGTSLETSETTSLSDEPLPGPSSECSTPKKRKVPKEVARLRTKVCRLKNLPDNTISFIETQIQMSKQSKHAKRWSISDKMLVLSIFYHSRKAYCLPSKSTLLRSLRKSNLSPGFSDKVFDALKFKVASMPQIACQCAVTFDEISLKSALAYNSCDVMSLKVLTTLATWGRAST